jgi:hypothetical protein
MADRNPRMLELARRLRERTETKALEWVPGAGVPGWFQVLVADQIVSIQSRDADGNHPFVLTLWRKESQGEEDEESDAPKWIPIDKLSTADDVRGEVGWESELADLWQEARQQALRVNDSIDAVLSQLA